MSLENVVWRSLSGSQAALSAGTDRIRRFAKGYSPIVGYADPAKPDFQSLAPYCEAGEQLYCAYWRGPVPRGWTVEVDASMCAMLWKGGRAPDEPPVDAVRLTLEHVPQMQALAALTRPGPFAERTIEMGEFYGVLEDGKLLAMAGERMHSGNLREISGVCTQPEHQGRGFARRLTELVIRKQLARGEVPFLHVISTNHRAISLYQQVGFAVEREVPLRVIRRV